MSTSTEDTGHGGGETPPPFIPTEEWLDAYAKQCTNAMRLDLKAYAKRRARGVGKVGGHVDEDYVEGLVTDALEDTLFGVVVWDPAKKALQQHTEDVIRSRTRHDRNRAKKYKHDRIDTQPSRDDARALRGLVEASLSHDQNGMTAESAIHAAQVVEQLRAAAGDDEDVHRYLDAIVSGAATRAEIMELAGMSARTFRNTRDRIDRLADTLDRRTVELLKA